MTTDMHPQVAEALQQVQEFQSAIEDQIHRTDTETFTGADEAETVEVTINGNHQLIDLFIEEGLLRLGGDVVGQRITEALHKAAAAASQARAEEQQQLMTSLSDIAGALKKGLGLA